MIQSVGLMEKTHLQRKKSIKTLYIISLNVLDAFVRPFLVFAASFTLV